MKIKKHTCTLYHTQQFKNTNKKIPQWYIHKKKRRKKNKLSLLRSNTILHYIKYFNPIVGIVDSIHIQLNGML